MLEELVQLQKAVRDGRSLPLLLDQVSFQTFSEPTDTLC